MSLHFNGMQLLPGQCYHIYNWGNNQEPIFFSWANHLYFLDKIRKHLRPEMRILARCLMPNHFPLLVEVRDESSTLRCSNAFHTLLSSYTRAIQK